MNGIKREQFKMKKITLLKGGGIEYHAEITINTDGDIYQIDRKDSVPIIPAPSLENPIRELKEKLLQTCHFLGIRTVVKTPPFNATNSQKEAIEKYIETLMSKAMVTGVSVSGQDKNEGVIISGKIKADNGSNIAINSPRMRYTATTYGFEADLETEIETIEYELFRYLYEGVKAQLEAFGKEEQAGNAGELPLGDGEA